jgi:hypothetical protein
VSPKRKTRAQLAAEQMREEHDRAVLGGYYKDRDWADEHLGKVAAREEFCDWCEEDSAQELAVLRLLEGMLR